MKKLSALLLLAATATVSTSTACLVKPVVVNGQRVSAEEGASLVYQQGQQALAEGDTAAATAHFEDLLERFATSSRAPDALAELGKLAMASGGCDAAASYFERLVSRHGDSERAQEARDGLAGCGQAVPESQEKSTDRFESASNDAERKTVASEAADGAIASGNFAAAVQWLLRVRAMETDVARRSAVEAEVIELIDGKVSFQDVRVLIEEIDDGEFPREVLDYKLGRIQYHVRDYSNAKETFEGFLKAWPNSKRVEGARHLLSLIEARSTVNPLTVGVLLPLSGKLKAYGKNVKQAIQLAVGELDAPDGQAKKSKKPRVKLVFRDSKGTAIGSARAMEAFVLEDGAVAVVGPLFRVEAEAAAYKAQELGIPLLTLSSAPRLTEIGPYVFRSGLTHAAQIDALVTYAMDIMGMKDFAVMYPRIPYGEEMLHLFWDRVAARNGTIRGVESYGAEDTTFTWQVKRLVGRDALDVRRDYRKARRECEKQPDNYRKVRCEKRVKTDLKPIVDFDGLFIPDYPQRLTLIAPALAFEDIIVENKASRIRRIEKTLGRKVKPVTLLGASGWNNPALPAKAERYVENAIFSDGFFSAADDKVVIAFVDRFRKEFKRTPILPDALFYDAVGIAKQIIENRAPATRNEFREALRRVDKYPGVTGVTSFVAGQEATKSVRILSIRDSKIVEAPPPSEDAPAPAEPAKAGGSL